MLARAMRRRLSWVGPFLLSCSVVSACGPRAPAEPPVSSESSAPPDAKGPPSNAETFADVPHGALEPREPAEIRDLSASLYSLESGIETWLFELNESELAGQATATFTEARVDVRGEGATGLFAFTDSGPASGASASPSGENVLRIWVRRRAETPRSFEPIQADVYQPAFVERFQKEPGRLLRFRLLPRAQARTTPRLFETYLQALGERSSSQDPVAWLLEPKGQIDETGPARRLDSGFGIELMRAASGYDSLEDALQTNIVLRKSRAQERATIPITTLEGPRLATHPWAEMTKRLPGRATPELMANFVPADFYYVRAKDSSSLERFLAHAETFGTPAFHALSPHGKLLNLAETYRTELGVPESEWTRVFGPKLIEELALTGSDPFLQSGSDLTLVLRVKDTKLFVAALEVPRQTRKVELQRSLVRSSGHEITLHQSADGSVRQHIATAQVGGAELVAISNSLPALERVIESWTKKRPSLAAEPDFSYMLARDPGLGEDLLFFAGDRFIARTMSPAERIQDARRHLAHADLLRLSYSDLLYRRVYGRAPASADELFRAPWLGPEYRTHVTGEKIELTPGRAPRSAFGTPGRLHSLLDLPTVERVTASEKAAYEELARNYEAIWGTRIDPIALRASTRSDALELHLRVLPVSQAGQYEDITRMSGGGTTRRQAQLGGLAGNLALGPESPLRQILTSQGRGFLGHKIEFDWLGEFVELGLADGPKVFRLAIEAPEAPLPPGAQRSAQKGEVERILELPLYLTLDIKSPGGAALFLAALRKLAADAAPGMVEWGEFAKVGKDSIVRIQSRDLSLYYALTDRRLHLSPSPETLRELLERGDTPSEATSTVFSSAETKEKRAGGELNVDLSPGRPKSGLFLALAWLLEGMRFEEGISDPKAELLLSARPELTSNSQDYFQTSRELLGYSPVTPEGKPLELRPEGLTDPLRGSRYRPVWPAAPIPGAPLAQVYARLQAARVELGIDTEPGSETERSLRSRVRIELTPAAPRPQD